MSDQRTHGITIRVSAEEKQELESAAKAAGKSVSEFLRARADGYDRRFAAVQEQVKLCLQTGDRERLKILIEIYFEIPVRELAAECLFDQWMNAATEE